MGRIMTRMDTTLINRMGTIHMDISHINRTARTSRIAHMDLMAMATIDNIF